MDVFGSRLEVKLSIDPPVTAYLTSTTDKMKTPRQKCS